MRISPMGWFEVVEFALIDSELIYDEIEKVGLIRERSEMAHSQQKSYADNRRHGN